MKIGLVADIDTASVFKIGGLEDIFIVNSKIRVKELLLSLVEQEKYAILLITDEIMIQHKPIIDQFSEVYEFPVFLSIPKLGSTKPIEIDTIKELVKRKIGIELK